MSVCVRYREDSDKQYRTVQMRVSDDGSSIVCESGTSSPIAVPFDEWDALVRWVRRERRRTLAQIESEEIAR